MPLSSKEAIRWKKKKKILCVVVLSGGTGFCVNMRTVERSFESKGSEISLNTTQLCLHERQHVDVLKSTGSRATGITVFLSKTT